VAFAIAGLLLLIGTALVLALTRQPIDPSTTAPASRAGTEAVDVRP
jgi:hypothetical protein